jgi:hypothetical protein
MQHIFHASKFQRIYHSGLSSCHFLELVLMEYKYLNLFPLSLRVPFCSHMAPFVPCLLMGKQAEPPSSPLAGNFFERPVFNA